MRKGIRHIGFLTVIAACLFNVSCENDLKDVEKIASKKKGLPLDITYGVSALYSDSAIVKARLVTPELVQYRTSTPYQEMPKGVVVIFYDDKLEESSRIVSDFAIRKQNEKIVEFRKNVVATDAKGGTFKSDELIWDENTRKVYSNQPVIITDKSGSVLHGTSFEAPQKDLSKFKINQGNGNIAMPAGQGL